VAWSMTRVRPLASPLYQFSSHAGGGGAASKASLFISAASVWNPVISPRPACFSNVDSTYFAQALWSAAFPHNAQ
jgi:hypothetical protein